MAWTIHVRDPLNQRQALLDRYEKFEAVKRLNKVGNWAIDVQLVVAGATNTAAVMLAQPGWGIEVVRDDNTALISGPIDRIERKRDEANNLLTLSGVDDMCHLDDRLIHPQPTTATPPYTINADYTDTGTASTVLRTAVNLNCGPGALPGRQKLTLGADPLIGPSITVRGRWTNFREWLEGYALAAGGLAFDVTQIGTALQFGVRQPADKSSSVKFSLELGNIQSYDYVAGAPKANYIVCGGQGEGTARTIKEGSSGTDIVTWGRRIEKFADRRDTSVDAELGLEITKTLEQNTAESSVQFTPISLPGMEFLTDYNLGDKVAAVVDDTITDLIREVKITSTPEQSIVVPSIGTPSVTDTLRLLQAFRKLESRTNALERR